MCQSVNEGRGFQAAADWWVNHVLPRGWKVASETSAMQEADTSGMKADTSGMEADTSGTEVDTSGMEADTIPWLSSGHELLGKRCARAFGKRCALGTISQWVDVDPVEGDPALFHVIHDDGDEARASSHSPSIGAVVSCLCLARDGAGGP